MKTVSHSTKGCNYKAHSLILLDHTSHFRHRLKWNETAQKWDTT